ncbi:hypothetical protein [Nocardia vermiculata]|uniref:Uncharacterized protein n=1 Tax=Nocardia vermiculata TaxID=257274 RepID=A0A846Y8P9_9NOCA|nr:hypothetical protein [Nocardia vermiculata]NKY54220.1 hypothetical protein [Nocardia vermiculata]
MRGGEIGNLSVPRGTGFGTPIDPAGFDDPEKLLDHLRQRIEELRE